MNIEKLQTAQEAMKALISAMKDVEKKSQKLHSMNFNDNSVKQRAAASYRLTDVCFARDRASDYLHACLVNAGLTPAKPAGHYATREIHQSAGFGHSISMKYTPAIPDCVREQMK
ncbi:hypothetical protein [Idiomarina sp.]|uniref:hypothetical protein n=1 Tax=Idiomarina sp. TaxID=1874361 RepID=UPI00257C3691|nr:hypothetical protein [Idiomarina sp.]